MPCGGESLVIRTLRLLWVSSYSLLFIAALTVVYGLGLLDVIIGLQDRQSVLFSIWDILVERVLVLWEAFRIARHGLSQAPSWKSCARWDEGPGIRPW